MTTKIEWCTAVWNPIAGCSIVSEGCRNCYAMKMAHRLEAMGQKKYQGLTRKVGGNVVWTGKLNVDDDAMQIPLKQKKPTVYFVNSMSDLFHEELRDWQIQRVFDVMYNAPQHIYQILTKRPKRMMNYLNSHRVWWHEWPHVWLGVSVEDQKTADERIPHLLETPAAVKFVSYEPALGPVHWTGWEFVDQIISGGESGPHARPSHPDWHRFTRDWCEANGVAYFYKQHGEWIAISQLADGDGPGCSDYPKYKNARSLVLQLDGRVENAFPIGAMTMLKIGKKEAGRRLDGKEYNEMPAARTGAGALRARR